MVILSNVQNVWCHISRKIYQSHGHIDINKVFQVADLREQQLFEDEIKLALSLALCCTWLTVVNCLYYSDSFPCSLSPQVDIEINGEPVSLQMKLGENGEAFFVKETESDEVSTGVLNQTINSVALFFYAGQGSLWTEKCNTMYASLFVSTIA